MKIVAIYFAFGVKTGFIEINDTHTPYWLNIILPL
jgi:hypothetical protein